MTQEYIPTDNMVKKAACSKKPTRLGNPNPINPSDYDRWLAVHDAQIRAEARDEGYTSGCMDGVKRYLREKLILPVKEQKQ